MAVVKADAYGHGSVEVARACIEAGADSLRRRHCRGGWSCGARDWNPRFRSSPISCRTGYRWPEHRLAVTAHSIPSARRIASRPGLEAHLKVNTGMNRWGVAPSEAGEARKILGPGLTGIYTHFASADSDEGATRRQIECFESVLALQPFGDVLVHAANSAATLWHPRSHYDCVRPGVALYGLHPAGDEGDPAAEGLRPAMTFKSYVAGVRRLARGWVSYGLTFLAEAPMFAATVPVGYAKDIGGRSRGGLRP